jgi:hypothetical protein
MIKIWGAAIGAGAILCVLEAATGPPASASDRHIEFVNDTRMAIVEIYASPVGIGRWDQDLLGDRILPPANSVLISIAGGTGYCRIDLKAVFDDGTAHIRRDVNVCAVERYAISYR